ncbi:MAG: phage baseplate assembly protein V [Succinivibrio sp.]
MNTGSIERATVTASDNTDKLRQVQVFSMGERTQDEVEHFEPYGFTSEPYTDGKTDVALAHFGEDSTQTVALIIADRRFRIKNLKTGEVCIYDDKGHKVYLHNDKIEVDGINDPIEVHTKNTVKVDCIKLNATCSASATITAPTITLQGNVIVTGTLTTNGDTIAAGISLDNHVHTGDSGGTTSKPR